MTAPNMEIRGPMRIEWDVPIEMDDGVVLRADVFRPTAGAPTPVIMSYGPYGKLLHFEDGYETAWQRMLELHPEVGVDSTCRFQSWEVADPEKWVPDGYAVVRVDSRGCGRSQGHLDLWSLREAQDYAQCIEWAAEQEWCDGKVGLSGISYYAMNQWQVASLQPPHLTAMCIWEGASDFYRELGYHGGILSRFSENWSHMQIRPVQHGVGARGYRSRMTGGWVAGPETLTEEELAAARNDFGDDVAENTLATATFWSSRLPDFDKIHVPFLSAANWGGQGLHTRGNFEGFNRAASEQKWLEVHGREHWTEFYTDYGLALQKKFFGHYLKGEDTGWAEQPRVLLQVRHPDGEFTERHEKEWPLARTRWTKMYLDASDRSLQTDQPGSPATLTYAALGDGVSFLSPALDAETELTGPIAAKLFVSSDQQDADLFLIVRAFSGDFREVVFQGALDPHTPIAQGWLRASRRKLDPVLSTEYRPFHTHDEPQPLTPGQVYELDIEIWPTSIALPAGYRLALSIRGRDYVYPGGSGGRLSNMRNEFTGVGPFQHDDPGDRPARIFGGNVTIHTGADCPSYVLLPVIPPQ